MPPMTSNPLYANFPSDNLTIGAGVAIFHLATASCVVCYHSVDKYWFLPKGRKNANENICRAAEREGFEESGYRNRLLPLPFKHRQTDADEGHEDFVTEAVWCQMMPVGSRSQYLLFWYLAETVPEEVERGYDGAEEGVSGGARLYRPPPPFPKGQTLEQRIAVDESSGYTPSRHPGTGVDEEELMYESYLLPIEQARRKLRGSVMEDVVRKGWEAVLQRREMEARGALG
ncbi:hypothetical protein MBLNU230_g0173t1 [Neophaeotheca triangularis]